MRRRLSEARVRKPKPGLEGRIYCTTCQAVTRHVLRDESEGLSWDGREAGHCKDCGSPNRSGNPERFRPSQPREPSAQELVKIIVRRLSMEGDEVRDLLAKFVDERIGAQVKVQVKAVLVEALGGGLEVKEDSTTRRKGGKRKAKVAGDGRLCERSPDNPPHPRHRGGCPRVEDAEAS